MRWMGWRLVLPALAVLLVCASWEAASGKEVAKTAGVRRNSAMHAKASSSSSAAKKKKKKKAASASAAAPKKKKKTTTTTTKKKKKRRDDDDVLDDDDDDDEDAGRRYRDVAYYHPRPKKPQGPSVWQRASEMAKVAAEQAVSASKTAADKAKVLGAEAASRAQKASRLAKAYYSSEYEKFLLTATWPSDARIPPQLTKRLVESVARFPSRPVSLPEDDPYRVTLRKLWKKMIEKDWRTSVKALYLMHALSRQAPTPKSRALSRTLKAMLADVDPKSGRKYFNRRDLVVKKADEDKARFVDAYAGFALRRTLLFAGKFDDVAAPKKPDADADGSCAAVTAASVKVAARRAQHALLVLDHAVQFVDVARSSYESPTAAHLVVVMCLDLVVADVHDAFALAHANVLTLVEALDASNLALSPAVTKDAHKSLEKFKDLRPRLQKATKQAVKTLRYFDLKASADLNSSVKKLKELTDDILDDAIDKWALRPATAPDEDDVDEDDDDDEDEDDDDEDDEDDDDDFDED